MKKSFLLLVVMLLSVSLFAEPADNFKAAGIGLGGFLNFSYDLENFLNDDVNYKESTTIFYVNPEIEFFMVDNLSISLSPNFSTYSNIEFNTDNDIDESLNFYSFGTDLKLTYYITTLGEIIPTVGVFVGFDNTYYLDAYSSGVESEDNTSYTAYKYGFDLGGLYFFNENLALRGLTTFSFSGMHIMTDISGDDYTYADDYDSSKWLDMDIDFYFGLTWYFPNNKKLIISEL